MSFTSWQFAVFVIVVFGAYYLPPSALCKSLFWSLRACSFTDMDNLSSCRCSALQYSVPICSLFWRCEPATWLPVGIVFNLALLAFFKYKFLFLNLATVGPTALLLSISC